MEKGKCILYPCYFNASLSRREGRRVPRSRGTKGAVIGDIERALKRAGIPYQVENHHHPAHWTRHEGRIIARWSERKGALIRKISQMLEGKR
jgi:signal recognition particle subunit SRP19